MSKIFFIKTLTTCNAFITKKEKRMGFINLATLGFCKTLGVSKNGTKVIEQFTKNGERVLSGFKPNSEIPFKQIVFHKNRVINNAQQYTSNLHRLNITEKHVTVNEIGKESKDIWTSIDNWFFNGQPSKTVIRQSTTQKGMQDKELLINKYHDKGVLNNSNYALFENNNIIKSGLLKST